MTKRTGFIITATYFVPIDKKDFAKQAAAYATMAEIEKTGMLPADFSGAILSVKAKQGTADVPDAPQGTQPDRTDPANWPLTTDHLPDGAEVLESTTDLAGHIFQTIRLADGTETFRRITAEQNDAELAAAPVTEMVGDKITKRGGKPVSE